MNIFIGIITFLRPEGLSRLLTGIFAQKYDKDSLTVHVVVVDNDMHGSGRAIISKLQATTDIPITYCIQKVRGIPVARNTILDSLSDKCGLLLFIDDDEIPAPNWVEAFVAEYVSGPSNALLGPVLPQFQDDPKQWMIEGKFFEKARPANGEVKFGSTANAAIDLTTLQQTGLRFNEHLALAGGSDTLFFDEWLRMNLTIKWADSAIVFEVVPASRLSLGWLTQRKFREGTSYVAGQRLRSHSSLHTVKFVAAGIARTVWGLACLPRGALKSQAAAINCICTMARGAGMVFGALGGIYNEYTSVHGK